MNGSTLYWREILLGAIALGYSVLMLTEIMRSDRKNTIKRSKVAVVVIVLLQCAVEIYLPQFSALARTVVQLLCSVIFLSRPVKPLILACAALPIFVPPLVLVYQALVSLNFLKVQNVRGQNNSKLKLFGLVLIAYVNPLAALTAFLFWDVYAIASAGKNGTEEVNPNPIEQFYAADLGLDLSQNIKKFCQSQVEKVSQFKERIRFECGDISSENPRLNVEQLYHAREELHNELFDKTEKEFIFAKPRKVDGYVHARTLELVQMLSMKYNFKLPQQESLVKLLLEYNTYPNRCMYALQYLDLIKFQTAPSPDEAAALVLTLLSFTIANPRMGDHEVVALQHYLSIIYNDRSPLQRAALSQTMQLL